MARILICHVPKDGGLARDLGATLMGRGHYVSFDGEPDSPRPDRASRLRQFEAVIVVWTEASVQNAGLSEIAREALPLNLLVPVRAEELATTRLPLMFRKLNMLGPRDIDGIARLVARLSNAASSLREIAASSLREKTETDTSWRASEPAPPVQQRSVVARPPAPAAPSHQRGRQSAVSEPRQPPPIIEAERAVRVRPLSNLPEVDADDVAVVVPTPPPRAATKPDTSARRSVHERPSAPVVTAEDLARAVDSGLLVYHIPEAMWLGSPTTVELTLGREILAGLIQAEVGHSGPAFADRQSVETLSVSVYGDAEAFEIERQSERTQFVTARHTRDPATFGRWAWLVTPRAAGQQDLVVRISAVLRDSYGVPAPVALPDRRFAVDIKVPETESLVSALAGWYRN